MAWQIMPEFDSYERARREFDWELPESYNPAVDFLRKGDREADPALIYDPLGEPVRTLTFGELDTASDRLADSLAGLGIGKGDRVAVAVSQKPANPITHLANWKLGAVSVPLTVLFGRDAIEYRLKDSGAVAVVTDAAVREAIEAAREGCPALEHVIELGERADGKARSFDALLESGNRGIEPYDATPETTTAIMYTSGSTGPPKGVRHGHALWLGRAAAAHTFFSGFEGATVWTPADWAWGAALGGTLFAAWHHGRPVIGRPREGFDPEAAFDLMERHGVTQAFMPPTALRMLMSVEEPEQRWNLDLGTLATAGEPLTPEVPKWVETTFEDVSVHEFYGQTELNLVVGNRTGWFEPKAGSMGRPLPGYEIRLLDPDTREPVPDGETGEIAVKPDDRRVFFHEYWNLPEKTAAKRTDSGWFLTGDIAERTDDGHLWFVSRADDVILTSGYRVGPTEVEEAILQHPNVEQAGVIGVPDETRGEAIKAFCQPIEGVEGNDDLRVEIRELVRERLAEYEYPREIEFLSELPKTSTGKIRRADLRKQEGLQ